MKKPKHKRRHQIARAFDLVWAYLDHIKFNVSSACGIGGKRN